MEWDIDTARIIGIDLSGATTDIRKIDDPLSIDAVLDDMIITDFDKFKENGRVVFQTCSGLTVVVYDPSIEQVAISDLLMTITYKVNVIKEEYDRKLDAYRKIYRDLMKECQAKSPETK